MPILLEHFEKMSDENIKTHCKVFWVPAHIENQAVWIQTEEAVHGAGEASCGREARLLMGSKVRCDVDLSVLVNSAWSEWNPALISASITVKTSGISPCLYLRKTIRSKLEASTLLSVNRLLSTWWTLPANL